MCFQHVMTKSREHERSLVSRAALGCRCARVRSFPLGRNEIGAQESSSHSSSQHKSLLANRLQLVIIKMAFAWKAAGIT